MNDRIRRDTEEELDDKKKEKKKKDKEGRDKRKRKEKKKDKKEKKRKEKKIHSPCTWSSRFLRKNTVLNSHGQLRYKAEKEKKEERRDES